jgi:transcriptional regulator with XRE-family HTH domain
MTIPAERVAGLAERILRLLKDQGKTARAASLATGRGPDVIRNILRAAEEGKPYSPRADTVKLLADELGVSIDDLLSENSRGRKLAGSFDPDEFEPEVAFDSPMAASSGHGRYKVAAGAIPEFDLRGWGSYGGGYALPAQVSSEGRTYQADVVKSEWFFPSEWLRGEMRLSTAHTDIIAVDGLSMIPDLAPGDRVLIDRTSRDPKLEAIYAIRDGESVVLKHVQLIRDGSDPPKIICRSSNQTYEPFTLTLDGVEVEIVGRVAGRISRM